jgi:peptide/nickel transport system permease protein
MTELEAQAASSVIRRGRASGFRRIGVAEGLSAAFLAFLLLAALAPDLISPLDPLGIDPANAFEPPSFGQVLGTDESGRSIFSRVVHGAGTSLLIGVAASTIGLGLGTILGVLAGSGGRIVDFGVSRFLEVLFALPGLLLALFLIVIVGPGALTTTLAVGLSTAPGYARIIRSQLITVRGSAYVEAATVLGLGRMRILARHVLPNTLAPLFALGTLGVGQAIVWASALSYLGLGAVPPSPEWGAMLAAGRTYLSTAWWMSVFPGLFIVLTAICATVLGRAAGNRTRRR